MKIAVTIESWRPNNGGAERSTQQIVKQLVSRGHRVVFLLGSPTRVSPCPGVEVRSAGAGKVNTAAAVRRYHRFVVEQLSRSEFDTSLSLTTLAPAAVLQPRAGVYRNLQQAALRVAVRGDFALGKAIGPLDPQTAGDAPRRSPDPVEPPA